MINMLVVFYLFLFIFAAVGAMRGWGKELLVTFSVILSMAFIAVIETYIPVLSPFLAENKVAMFWTRIAVTVGLVLFGYQSPRSIARLKTATEKRERVSDLLLGIVMGLLSGYMVVGTLWFFLHQAEYFPIRNYVVSPDPNLPRDYATLRLLNILPPQYLMKVPNIFIAVVIAFIFVIVVFV